ncbi:hypothetical protein THAR02_09472 [Trichoderma harzianum]|uniref:Uncharacterized protein n=1 Tax=Trichoderma harzianum TaxID=5544 RepID=A0A0F9X165_TRIHA|nr:hypothetical protein THAR02_09472 [Trichoderma harzianum]
MRKSLPQNLDGSYSVAYLAPRRTRTGPGDKRQRSYPVPCTATLEAASKKQASGPLHFGCPRRPSHGGAQQHHQTIPRPAVAPPAPPKYHLLGLLATLLSLSLMIKVWHSIYSIKYVSNSQTHPPHRPAALHRPKSAGASTDASTDASSLQSPEATANHLTL